MLATMSRAVAPNAMSSSASASLTFVGVDPYGTAIGAPSSMCC